MSNKEQKEQSKSNNVNQDFKEKEENTGAKAQNLELEQLKSKLIRVNADFDNFKKRVKRERAEWENLAEAYVIKSFLPILDDLERALQSSAKEKDTSLYQGLNIVLKNFKKTLDDLSVEEVDCQSGFDPNLHEALVQVDSKEHKTGDIVQVLNKGYIFKEQVIRYAKVSVAK